MSNHDASALVVVQKRVTEVVLPPGVSSPGRGQKFIRFHEGQVVSEAEAQAARDAGLDIETGPMPKSVSALPGAIATTDAYVNAPTQTPEAPTAETPADAGTPGTPELTFDPADHRNIDSLKDFAAANDIDLDGATRREDIEAAIASDPRVLLANPSQED